MKTISVVAAVIFRTSQEGVRSVFATQRGYGEYKGWWESLSVQLNMTIPIFTFQCSVLSAELLAGTLSFWNTKTRRGLPAEPCVQ